MEHIPLLAQGSGTPIIEANAELTGISRHVLFGSCGWIAYTRSFIFLLPDCYFTFILSLLFVALETRVLTMSSLHASADHPSDPPPLVLLRSRSSSTVSQASDYAPVVQNIVHCELQSPAIRIQSRTGLTPTILHRKRLNFWNPHIASSPFLHTRQKVDLCTLSTTGVSFRGPWLKFILPCRIGPLRRNLVSARRTLTHTQPKSTPSEFLELPFPQLFLLANAWCLWGIPWILLPRRKPRLDHTVNI